MICAGRTALVWTYSDPGSMRPIRYREGNRPRWGVRTSNPSEAASLSLVGSTPALFRHLLPKGHSMTAACTTDFDDWIVATFARIGSFTMLIVLVEIGETSISLVASSYLHIIGDETRWPDMVDLLTDTGRGGNGSG